MPFDIERVHHAARRVTKFLEKNRKRPGSNDVHGLRTSVRSLQTALTTFGLDSRKRVAQLLRDLENVRKRAGKVRDMDVLTAKVFGVTVEGEQDCHVRLFEHLLAERSRYTRKLRRDIKTDGMEVSGDIKQAVRQIEKLSRQAKIRPSDSEAAAMARTVQLASELQRPARLGRNNLHAYRLKVKELRDVLLLSEQGAAQEDDQEFVQQLGIVKDAIGEWHDWEELVAIAAETLDHGSSCALIKELHATADEKYDEALSFARRLRTHYLASRVPVLQAPSAIA